MLYITTLLASSQDSLICITLFRIIANISSDMHANRLIELRIIEAYREFLLNETLEEHVYPHILSGLATMIDRSQALLHRMIVLDMMPIISNYLKSASKRQALRCILCAFDITVHYKLDFLKVLMSSIPLDDIKDAMESVMRNDESLEPMHEDEDKSLIDGVLYIMEYYNEGEYQVFQDLLTNEVDLLHQATCRLREILCGM